MPTDKPYFTSEEISHIDKNLPFIVSDWAEHLIMHIVSKAKNNNVKVIYMNTPQTLHGSNTEEKVNYFYEKIPEQLGFTKETVKLRKKPETFWSYHLDTKANQLYKFLKLAEKIYTINDIPQKYQGAFIQILGKKQSYTLQEIQRVLQTIEKSKKQKESLPRFFYDWSKTWSGGQRFMENVSKESDMVVVQKIPSQLQNYIAKDPILLKLWNLLMSQSTHFGEDSLGFALIHKYNPDIWVINEIQTDTINIYLRERNKLRKDKSTQKTKLSWDSIKDMLEAQNRSNWIPIIENNETMKNYLIEYPNTIAQLPDNTESIPEFLEAQRLAIGRDIPQEVLQNLRQHMAECDFVNRIFLIG